jgi:hypothetical protein
LQTITGGGRCARTIAGKVRFTIIRI